MGKLIDERTTEVAVKSTPKKAAEKPKERGTQNGGDDTVLLVMRKFEKENKLIIMPKNVVFLNEWVDNDGKLNADMKSKSVIDDEWGDHKIKLEVAKDEFKYPKLSTVALKGAEGINTSYPPMERWQGVTFRPDGSKSKRYNSFKGFPIKPKEGDISIFVNSMEKVFGKRDFAIIMDWFASMYQNPSKKILWSVVVKGEKGTGKNTVEEMLGKRLLHIENYFRTSDQEALFGRFSMHLAYNLLLVGQEIIWGGEHKKDSSIKELITESTRKVEPKGVDAFTLDNYSRLYMTSNADWVVPASGKGERRYFVVETNSDVVSKKEWKKLYDWSDTPEAQEALMYEMLHRDISEMDHHTAPNSEALSAQKEQSLYGVERFVFELIEDGTVQYRDGMHNKVLTMAENGGWPAKELYAAFTYKYPRIKITNTKFGKELQKYLQAKKIRSSKGIFYHPLMREECANFFYDEVGVLPNHMDLGKNNEDVPGEWLTDENEFWEGYIDE